jgi:hypothetical protein
VDIEYRKATLLTGVDVVRCGGGVLEMIKHRSRLYDIEGGFYFLPLFTLTLYSLPSFTFTSIICHSLL